MNAGALRTEAEQLYRSKALDCSEAVVHTLNRALGAPLSADALKMASGFAVGMGGLDRGGCTCGALTGGVMMLGLLYGRSTAFGSAPLVLAKSKELRDWFVAENGTTSCRALVQGSDWSSPCRLEQCVRFTGAVTAKVAEMVQPISDGAQPDLGEMLAFISATTAPAGKYVESTPQAANV